MKIKLIYLMSFVVMLGSIPSAFAVDPIEDYDFDRHFDNLSNSNFTLGNLTTVGAAPYEDLFDDIFWGALFSLIFIILWISMEDITIPTLLGMIIGGTIWSMMPPEWVQVGMSLTVVSFAGLVYSLIKRGQS